MTENMNSIDSMLSEPDNAPQIGALAVELADVSGEISTLEKRKRELKAQIMEMLDNSGQDSATANGRRVGFTTRKYYGIAEGESPEQYEQNLRSLKLWLEAEAPEINIPASANIGKAVAAYLDAHPGEEMPSFVKVTERRSLTNAKAK